MMRGIPVWLLVWLLAGCEAAPPGEGGQGVPTDVEILDESFVRFEGERLPLEAFYYEMRRRVRDAGDDPARRPWVRVRASTDLGPQGAIFMDGLVFELQKAGVARVSLGR